MSLILDALSRAERDKRAGESATPDILSQPPPVEQPVRFRWPVILLVGFAIALSLAGAYWLYQSPEPSAQIVTTSKSSGTTARSPLSGGAQSSPPSGAQPKPSRGLAAPVSAREVAALYAESAAQTPLRETDDGEVGSVSSPADPATVSGAPAASIDVERVLRKVRREYPLNKDEAAEHPAPLLEALSQQFRDSVPTLMYSHHDYNAGGRSSVLLNGQTLFTGQTTRGVEVLEILADSVVLRFAGRDFRLRSLNSWVNL